MAPVAMDGCQATFIERDKNQDKTSGARKIFIYDLERRQVKSTFVVDSRGDFQLLSRKGLLMLDEAKMVPNVLPDGTTVGVRSKQTGRLLFYDAAARDQSQRTHAPRRRPGGVGYGGSDNRLLLESKVVDRYRHKNEKDES